MRFYAPTKTPKADGGRVRLFFQMPKRETEFLLRSCFKARRGMGGNCKKYKNPVRMRKLIYALLVMNGAFIAVSSGAQASSVIPSNFAVLAGRCAPSVTVSILKAVASTESSLDPFALHDDTTGEKDDPVSQAQAQTEADQWLRRGDSVDIGLMQINSRNLFALNLTLEQALDPCASLSAGAAVLRAAYGSGHTPAEQQVALLMALSRYNTGSPFRGIMNGYAHSVLANMSAPLSSKDTRMNEINTNSDPNVPPEWNVSDSGVYAEAHGAPWLIAFSSETSSTSSAR